MMAGSMDLSRRSFLTGTAALTFTVGSAGIVAISRASPAERPLAANAWVRIGADERIQIIFPSTEMGQGSSTALPMIVAEELDADWDRVEIVQLDRDDRTYGNPLFGNVLYTAGSTGVYGYFDTLRLAGAQARAVLIAIAADEFGVSPGELVTEPGAVLHPPSGRRLSYGQLAALAPDTVDVPSDPPLKSPEDYRLIGPDVTRRDIPAKSNGTETFVWDVQVPGMLYASVLRAPVEGERPLAVDDEAVLAMAHVVATVPLPDGVAVVARRQEAAAAGKAALSVTWSDTAPARAFDSEASLAAYTAAANDTAREGAVWRTAGDAAAAIQSAERTVEATYLSDYAYHAQIEPMAAVASVDEDGEGAEVWAATQTQSWTMRTITETLGTTPDRIRLHMMTMGGSFGRRTALEQEYVRDALLASKAVGAPVKVTWSREDDVKFGAFRPAAAQKLRAGLTGAALQGWHHRVAAPSVIKFFNPLRWAQVEPQDIIVMRGSESQFYALPDILAEHVMTERGARLAPWRGIGASYTSFAAEAFMDELASEAGTDPIAFRMALLQHNERGRRLLERVAALSGWGRPPGETALGVAFAGYGASMAAGVAEVSVDRASGAIRVHHFWATVDAGLVVAPDNAVAQVEGGIVYGVSSALKERITIKDGEVQQNNFYDYPILRMSEAPQITVEIQSVDAPPTGIGEVGTPMVVPAIANAMFALTGRRLRHMPFTPERVLAALS
ncbi:MAG: molybdopterin cofactor-binding domain-containing protein [Pseudomonadota bacterium]